MAAHVAFWEKIPNTVGLYCMEASHCRGNVTLLGLLQWNNTEIYTASLSIGQNHLPVETISDLFFKISFLGCFVFFF